MTFTLQLTAFTQKKKQLSMDYFLRKTSIATANPIRKNIVLITFVRVSEKSPTTWPVRVAEEKSKDMKRLATTKRREGILEGVYPGIDPFATFFAEFRFFFIYSLS